YGLKERYGRLQGKASEAATLAARLPSFVRAGPSELRVNRRRALHKLERKTKLPADGAGSFVVWVEQTNGSTSPTRGCRASPDQKRRGTRTNRGEARRYKGRSGGGVGVAAEQRPVDEVGDAECKRTQAARSHAPGFGFAGNAGDHAEGSEEADGAGD